MKMKSNLLSLVKLMLLAVVMSASIVALGQTEVTYTFSDNYSNAGEIGSGSIDANLDFVAEKNSSSTNPTYYDSGSAARFYYNSSGDGGSYTLTTKNGVMITALEIYTVSTSYSPNVNYNVDGGSDIAASLSGTTYTITGLSASTSLKFRNANTSNVQLRITGFKVTYNTVSTDPTITVSTASLSGFSYITGNGPSANQTFTVSGSNLTNHITITPPAQYEISQDGTNFFLTYGSITLVISGGAVAPTTIYVRLKENLPIGNYNQDITLSSFGAPSKTVSCSGSVIPVLPNLVINEILADPDATNGDANGDGTVNTSQDEFVEIVNNDTYAVNLYGYTLSDGYGVRHTFSSITLNPNEAIIVFGGGSPTGFLTYAITASSGSLGLNNTGDDVILKNSSSFVIDSYTYGSEAGNNQSITRDPDLTGSSFVQHSTATGSEGALFSPGNHIDGSPFSIPPPPAPPVPLDWRYILALFSLLGIAIVYRRLR
jgi:hypothetical protein